MDNVHEDVILDLFQSIKRDVEHYFQYTLTNNKKANGNQTPSPFPDNFAKQSRK